MRVPTPNPSIGAPAATRSSTANSSRLPLTKMVMSGKPPASRIVRTRRAIAARSPLSMRTPLMRIPSRAQAPGQLDHPVGGAFGVVGVDQQDRVRRAANARSARTRRPRRRVPGHRSAPSCRARGWRTGGRPPRSPCPRSPPASSPWPTAARRRPRARGATRNRPAPGLSAAITQRAALLATIVW